MPIITGLNANVFRAVSGSLFSSPINWSRGVVPTGSDVAFIADNCVIDINRTLGSLVVQPGFTASISGGLTLRVNDVINVMGHMSCSGNPTVLVMSNKNLITSLSPASSTFHFSSSLNTQTVPGVTYNNVIASGPTTKRLSGNAIISGSLTLNTGVGANFTGGPTFDCYLYDLVVSGSTNVGLSGASLSKTGPGRMTFIGNMFGNDGNGSRLNLIGNPTVEFRNGVVIQFYATNGFFDSGQGLWIFTTNNQNIEPRYANYNVRDTILISGSIDVTVLGGSARSPIILSGLTNGTNANSRLINSGSIYLNYAPSPIPMSTGSFIYNATSSARLGFVFDGNYQLPYSSYPNLTIAGSGTKSFPAISSSVSASSLNFISFNGGSSIFNISASNFYCGNVDISIGGSSLLKTGPGNVTIDGNVFMAQSTLDFREGNPSVTFTGNLTNGANAINGFFSGTGSWYFPSVTQSIIMPYVTLNWNGPLLVSGTLKFESAGIGYTNVISGSINGTNSSARIINSASLVFATADSISSSFATGIPDFTFVGNTVSFGGNYSGTSSTRLNTFYNLSISGTGIKTLGTSSFVSGSLTNNSNGILELGNNDLFVSGTTNVGDGGVNIFRKSGSGSITFVGEIARLGWNSGTGSFDLSGGNPNVEVRGGIRTLGANTNTFKSGFGTWSFAVNNQRIRLDNYAVPSGLTFSGSVLIKDGINLIIDPYGANGGFPGLGPNMAVVIMKDINGTTSAAKLTVSGALYFASSSRSMTTGTLDNTSPGNVLGFVSSENHPLYYSTFSNLYIGGSGIKYATSSLYVSGGLTMFSGALDIGVYDMFVSGTTNLQGANLIKTSSGNVTFNGQMSTLSGGSGMTPTMSLSGAYVELRNGIILDITPSIPQTQTFYFTTNNQIITSSNAFTQPGFGNTNFIISGAINLTISPAFGLGFSGYIDGTDPNSKLIVGRGPVPSSAGGGIVYYSSSIMPMATSGTFDASSSLNVFIYNGGAQDIKGGIYRNLTFSGGPKTLRGNVSVLNTLSTGSTVVNLNGFTLTNP